MVRKKIFTVVAGAVILMGCSSSPKRDVESDTTSYIMHMVNEKAQVAVNAQRELVAVQYADKELILKRQLLLETDELEVDFIGRPQRLLEALALRYEYKFIETGKPVELKPVNVRTSKRPVLEILRDVGYQIDPVADIVLDKQDKAIRLIYKKG